LAGFAALVLIEMALHIASASRVASLLPMHLVLLGLMSAAGRGKAPSLAAFSGMVVILAVTLWLWQRERTRTAARLRMLPSREEACVSQ
jgi:uncharacterized membrane protein